MNKKPLKWSRKVACASTVVSRQANKVSLAGVDSCRVHTDSSYQSLSATCRLDSRGVVFGLGLLSGRWAGRRCCLSGSLGLCLVSILHNSIWTAAPWPAPGLPLAPDREFLRQDNGMRSTRPSVRDPAEKRRKPARWLVTFGLEKVWLMLFKWFNCISSCWHVLSHYKIWNLSNVKHQQLHRYSLASQKCWIWTFIAFFSMWIIN